MQKTSNYSLPQWAVTDGLKRGDFNRTMETIDTVMAGMSTELAALATSVAANGNCRIAWGSYTGTGTCGADNPNSLSFDFKPMIVFIGSDSRAGSDTNPAVLIRGRKKAASDGMTISAETQIMQLTWNESGVSWYCTENAMYQSNMATVYYYVALGISA